MKKVDIFVFVDALGHEVIKKHPWFLDKLKYRKAVTMQFGYSSTALPTILTGRSPREHEHFSFFYYDPENSPFRNSRLFKLCSFLPLKLQTWWRLRGIISDLVKKLNGFTGYFQLYNMNFLDLPKINYCEKNDIFAENAFQNIDGLRDLLIKNDKKFFISPWQNTEEENYEKAKDVLNKGDVDFLFMYTAGLDGVLHSHCCESAEAKSEMNKYEDMILGLQKVAEDMYEDVSITIISDHGMTPHQYSIDLKKTVNDLGFVQHKDYFAVYDSTMMRVWYFNSLAKNKIRRKIQEVHRKDGHFLSTQEKIDFGIDFENDKFGNDIFLLRPGGQIVPSDMGKNAMPGMHGYHPVDKDSNAAVISSKPIPEYVSHVSDFFKLFKECI